MLLSSAGRQQDDTPLAVHGSLPCQQLELRCRAPSFASATEKSRAAVVYPACPTARGRTPSGTSHIDRSMLCIERCQRLRRSRVLLCQSPAYHTLAESTPDMVKRDLPSSIICDLASDSSPLVHHEGDLNSAMVCLCCAVARRWSLRNVRVEILARLVFSSTSIAPNATPRDLHNLARAGAQHGLTKRHNSIMPKSHFF